MKHVINLKKLARVATITCCASFVSACGGIIPAGEAPSSYRVAQSDTDTVPTRTTYSSRQPARVASTPASYTARSSERTCFSDLSASGAHFNPVPDTYSAPGCNKLGTVQLSALSGDHSQFGISNLGPVKCGTAKAFSDWARFGVDRAAKQILGSRLARIETMGSYACRNIAGSSKRSAHSTGNAIDVSGFVLEDGRRIVLKSDWDGGTPAEREFLRIVQKSACKRFGTVLGPEYNAAHKDHFHLEGTGAKFCR